MSGEFASRLKAQLTQELTDLCYRVGTLIPSVNPMTNDLLRTQIARASADMAAQLTSADDQVVAQIVIDIQTTFWPTSDPDPDWWDTPIGHMSLRSIGADNAPSWTHAVAAAKIGCRRESIARYVQRRKLDRHPDGGVTIPSVLTYVDRMNQKRGR